MIALGNTLPGPIITKVAGYVGYRVGGWLGMLNALFSSTLPTIIIMIVLLKSLASIKSFDWVQGMIAAVIPVVGVMMATLTWNFFSKAGKNLGWLATMIMCLAFFAILQIFHIHPAILIAALLIIALVKKDKNKANEKDKEGKVS